MRKVTENIMEKSFRLVVVNILEMLLEVIIVLTIIFEILFVSRGQHIDLKPQYCQCGNGDSTIE
jgi:hypothetical protein